MRKFTLIELLVVVAIIGILSSILMPSLSQARQKVKSTVCLNNLKNKGMANILYAGENDSQAIYTWIRDDDGITYWFQNEQFTSFLGVNPGNEDNPGNFWFWGLAHLCPTSPTALPSSSSYQLAPASYAHNGNNETGTGTGSWADNGTVGSRSLGNISNTSAVLFSDATRILVAQTRSYFSDWLLNGDDYTTTPGRVAYRHNKGANYVAFDGSAHHGTQGKIDNQEEAWQSGL